MKNAALKNSKWFNSTKMVALAVLTIMTMTGCPGKKNSNNVATPAYNYGGQYCASANCYGTVAGYGQMFATGLGKIISSQLQAEIALNISTTAAVNPFVMNSYNGNTQLVGTMNVYASSYFCPIPPGQYQVYGTGTFGSGVTALSFTGNVSAGSVAVVFQNSFLTAAPTASVMGPSFPFKVQGWVDVMSPYGSCGQFVIE